MSILLLCNSCSLKGINYKQVSQGSGLGRKENKELKEKQKKKTPTHLFIAGVVQMASGCLNDKSAKRRQR